MLQRADSETDADARQVASMVSSGLLLWAGIWWLGPVIHIAAGRMADYLPAELGDLYSRWIVLYAAAVAMTAVVGLRLGPPGLAAAALVRNCQLGHAGSGHLDRPSSGADCCCYWSATSRHIQRRSRARRRLHLLPLEMNWRPPCAHFSTGVPLPPLR